LLKNETKLPLLALDYPNSLPGTGQRLTPINAASSKEEIKEANSYWVVLNLTFYLHMVPELLVTAIGVKGSRLILSSESRGLLGVSNRS
jgi:hypothetical protein